MGDLSHRQDREDLAAALRMAARQSWQSGICNHFSLAVDANSFLRRLLDRQEPDYRH